MFVGRVRCLLSVVWHLLSVVCCVLLIGRCCCVLCQVVVRRRLLFDSYCFVGMYGCLCLRLLFVIYFALDVVACSCCVLVVDCRYCFFLSIVCCSCLFCVTFRDGVSLLFAVWRRLFGVRCSLLVVV